MSQLNEYKQGLKSYRNGFGIGILIGTGICLYVGKPLLFIPVCLALVIGSIMFERKIERDGKSSK